MSKWTPGPWSLRIQPNTWDPTNEPGYPDSVVDANGKDVVVSCMTVTSNSWAEGVANARLIAEAPAMAELLESAVTLIDGDLVGPEWKAACHEFTSNARALLARLEAE